MATIVLPTGASYVGSVAAQLAGFAAAFRSLGHRVLTPDSRAPDYGRQIAGAAAGGDVAFVLCHSGIGFDQTPGPANLYRRLGIAVVAVYVDPALLYWDQIALDDVDHLVTLISEDDVAWCRRQLPGRRFLMLPHAADPIAQPLPWSERDLEIILVASAAGAPDDLRAAWRDFGPAVAARLEAMLEAQAAEPERHLADLVAATGRDLGLDLSAPLAAHPYVATLDRYLRSSLRWQAAETLLDRPLTVIGDGWQRLAARGGPARFLGRLELAEAQALVGRAKLSLNPTTGYHGSHERVFHALAAGTAAMTTDGAFWRELGADLPLRRYRGRPVAALPVGAVLQDAAERGHTLLAGQHDYGARARRLLSAVGW
ncbi:MAG: hypothetical protein J0H82_14175 [Alphaproteobacteria bacterium]|jgi:hypothetical protein|nr:hypothetical protein [Alphaproteobacteria bacterium]